MTLTATDRSGLRAPAAVALTGASAFALLYARDPHTAGSYGFCPFLAVTGLPCPGCGGLRAVHDLTHGDVVAAISSNVLVVALVGFLAVAWVGWVVRRVRDTADRSPMVALSTRAGLAVIAVMVTFGILRNLPFAGWLAP